MTLDKVMDRPGETYYLVYIKKEKSTDNQIPLTQIKIIRIMHSRQLIHGQSIEYLKLCLEWSPWWFKQSSSGSNQ